MSEDLTNQILKLIDPVFQQGYAGDGIDVNRIMTAMKRLSKVSLLQEVCDWHIECETKNLLSHASIILEYELERPFIPDSVSCLLDEQGKTMAEQIMETIDLYGTSEPKIDDFIERVVRAENAASWSSEGWRERLIPLAGMAGFDLLAHYSARMSQDMGNDVRPALEPSKPGARM